MRGSLYIANHTIDVCVYVFLLFLLLFHCSQSRCRRLPLSLTHSVSHTYSIYRKKKIDTYTHAHTRGRSRTHTHCVYAVVEFWSSENQPKYILKSKYNEQASSIHTGIIVQLYLLLFLFRLIEVGFQLKEIGYFFSTSFSCVYILISCTISAFVPKWYTLWALCCITYYRGVCTTHEMLNISCV